MDCGWGPATFPMVPGHEIVGIVTAVGPQVKDLKVGMRVGVGPQRWSCGTCPQCVNHQELLCPKVHTFSIAHIYYCR
jgi:D-arabinose 1-dehydrogenase-like Zn-dependent alcohol dehydrogenase